MLCWRSHTSPLHTFIHSWSVNQLMKIHESKWPESRYKTEYFNGTASMGNSSFLGAHHASHLLGSEAGSYGVLANATALYCHNLSCWLCSNPGNSYQTFFCSHGSSVRTKKQSCIHGSITLRHFYFLGISAVDARRRPGFSWVVRLVRPFYPVSSSEEICQERYTSCIILYSN